MLDLYHNNNQRWFDENRHRYEQHVRQPMKALAESLTGPLASILPEYTNKVKVSRINNDVRFHAHKPPYKEYIWISFCAGTDSNAELFASIGRHGWSTGCKVDSPGREPLDDWRRNLLDNADLWRRYWNALGSRSGVQIHTEKGYKRPLFPNIPEDLMALVQAKGVWVYKDPKREFERGPEQDFLRGLCEILPMYLFMVSGPGYLNCRLDRLVAETPPPDGESAALWKMIKG